ncbi:MAG TPA: SRPBCC domain-containing protein, partial [Micromonosporaceae bacterium]
ERIYDTAPSGAFAAYSTEEERHDWGESGKPEQSKDEGVNEVTEFDFRAGGRECFTTSWEGTTYRYEGRYHDIVNSSRIVYSYAMYADDSLISVSLATIEFAESGDGTRLTWTEQGAYLDGYNGSDAPAMRKNGTLEMIEGLSAYLHRQEPR